jgi:hypothetical protein
LVLKRYFEIVHLVQGVLPWELPHVIVHFYELLSLDCQLNQFLVDKVQVLVDHLSPLFNFLHLHDQLLLFFEFNFGFWHNFKQFMKPQNAWLPADFNVMNFQVDSGQDFLDVVQSRDFLLRVQVLLDVVLSSMKIVELWRVDTNFLMRVSVNAIGDHVIFYRKL